VATAMDGARAPAPTTRPGAEYQYKCYGTPKASPDCHSRQGLADVRLKPADS